MGRIGNIYSMAATYFICVYGYLMYRGKCKHLLIYYLLEYYVCFNSFDKPKLRPPKQKKKVFSLSLLLFLSPSLTLSLCFALCSCRTSSSTDERSLKLFTNYHPSWERIFYQKYYFLMRNHFELIRYILSLLGGGWGVCFSWNVLVLFSKIIQHWCFDKKYCNFIHVPTPTVNEFNPWRSFTVLEFYSACVSISIFRRISIICYFEWRMKETETFHEMHIHFVNA